MPHMLPRLVLLAASAPASIASGAFVLAAAHPSDPLPVPSQLRVDGLDTEGPSCALGVTARPRLTAAIDAPLQRHSPFRGLNFTVVDAAGEVVWTSGMVEPGPDGGAACEPELDALASFTVHVSWTTTDGRVSPVAVGCFDTGLLTNDDWRGAQWVGAGHGMFVGNISTQCGVTDLASMRARAYLSAPGGALLFINGQVASSDAVGVAPWLDFTKALYVTTIDLSRLVLPNNNEVVLLTGCGAWCPSTAPTWAHSGRRIKTTAGAQPMARLLITVECAGHEQTVLVSGTGPNAFTSGSVGPVLASSSWFGSTIDHTMPALDHTTPATPPRLVPHETLLYDVPPLMSPLLQPAVATDLVPTMPATVQKVGSDAWLYYFEEMIVGTASVRGDAWGGNGRISIEYCEVMLDLSKGTCLRQHGFQQNGTIDVHIVDKLTGPAVPSQGRMSRGETDDLHTMFSWRGFRYAVVKVEGGVTFRGNRDDIYASWSAISIDDTASIQFEGGENEEAATMLQAIVAMAKRTQRSNMVSGLPTDCPTREKHGWLGDALSAAAGEMMNFDTGPVHRLFLNIIADGQAYGGPAVDGFVPVVVPCHQGVDAASNDLSWTSGFVMTARLLGLYYGDHSTLVRHYSQLKRWTDGQLRNASTWPGGMPAFFTYGDMGLIYDGIDREAWMTLRRYVGTAAAALNFIGALAAMVDIASAVSVSDDRENATIAAASDAIRWNTTLAKLRIEFASQYWNSATGSFCNGSDSASSGLQTINSLALASKVGTPAQRVAAGKVLIADVTRRGYALSVGAVGSRTLLNVLSDQGADGHDAALRLVLRRQFPGWGYMVMSNASTCWEGWDNETSPAYTMRGGHFHGSHNHAWLCGGISEWVYTRLAGVLPTSDGYETLRIAPLISNTFGPDGLSLKLQTVRGVVWSNWTREQEGTTQGPRNLFVVQVAVEIPPLVRNTEIVLPLLGHSHDEVAVALLQPGAHDAVSIWPLVSAAAHFSINVTPQRHPVDSSDHLILSQIPSGRYAFRVLRSSSLQHANDDTKS